MPDFQPPVAITVLREAPRLTEVVTSAQRVRGEFQVATNVNSVQLRGDKPIQGGSASEQPLSIHPSLCLRVRRQPNICVAFVDTLMEVPCAPLLQLVAFTARNVKRARIDIWERHILQSYVLEVADAQIP
jgi:hypothetical protein